MDNAGTVGAPGTPDYTGLLAQQNASMDASLKFQTTSSTYNIAYDSQKTALQTTAETMKGIEGASHLV